MKAFLSLGSNKFDRAENLRSAMHFLAEHMSILHKSSVYQTKAWGNTNQDDFYNAVIEVETLLTAHDLMQTILDIEMKMGRIRTQKWEAREIDIDILFYEDAQINEKDLCIPHPFFHERKFVISPMLELNPQYLHPVFNKTIHELSLECKDTLDIYKLHDINL